jgi:hypothetical protein
MSLVEKGRRGPVPLGLTGLAGIAVGLSASATVRLVGSTRGVETSDLTLRIQVGATAFALADSLHNRIESEIICK